MAGYTSILALCFAVGLASTSALLDFKGKTQEEFRAISAKAAEECRVSNNVRKGDWENMAMKRVIPDEKNIQCMIACFLEQFGSLKKNGELDWEVITDWNKLEHGPSGIKYVETCRPKVSTEGKDRCTLAKEILLCYFEEGEKLGLLKKL